MEFVEQKIEGVYLIRPEPFVDERGLFRRIYCSREFQGKSIESGIAQCNISENRTKHTLRGFHYQDMSGQEAKTILCVRGSVYDIVVDVREDSPTYLKWISFDLTSDNRHCLHVPRGCANAYLTLSDNTWILYLHSESYAAQLERGIRYDDPLFSFEWPAEPKSMSEKDKLKPGFIPATPGLRGGRI